MTSTAWPGDSPEGAFTCAFAAFRSRDGHALGAVVSSGSLDRYRRNILQRATPRFHEWTAESLRAHRVEMPIEVAEWQLQQMMHHQANHEADLLRSFARVTSLDELRSLDAAELLARAIEAAPRGMTMHQLDEVLGHMREGKITAHVLYRTHWRDPSEGPEPHRGPEPYFDPPDIATLSLENRQWRLELDALSETGMPGFRHVGFIGEHALPP